MTENYILFHEVVDVGGRINHRKYLENGTQAGFCKVTCFILGLSNLEAVMCWFAVILHEGIKVF